MNHHHRRIRTSLATAVAIATPLALASSASATRVIEPTRPGPGPIHHIHILRISGATATNQLTGAALNPLTRLGPGAVDVG